MAVGEEETIKLSLNLPHKVVNWRLIYPIFTLYFQSENSYFPI